MNYVTVDTEDLYLSISSKPDEETEIVADCYKMFRSAPSFDLSIGAVYFDGLTKKDMKRLKKQIKEALEESEVTE